MMFRKNYAAVCRQLGLSESKTEALLDVLAAQAGRHEAEAKTKSEGEVMGPDLKRDRAEIAAAIGADNAVKVDRWRRLSLERMEVRSVRDHLEEMAEPLTHEQEQRLSERVQAVFTEQGESPLLEPERQDGETREAYAKRFHAWRKDAWPSRRAALASVLTAQQLKHYDELSDFEMAFDIAE